MSGRPPPPLPPSASAPARTSVDRVEAVGQVGGDADDDRRLALGARHHRDDAGADAPLQVVGQRAAARVRARRRPAAPSNAMSPIRLAGRGARAAGRAPAPARSPAARRASASSRSSRRCSSTSRARRAGSSVGLVRNAAADWRSRSSSLREMGFGRSAGQRLDPAHAGGDRTLADDLEQTDIAGAAAHACRRTARPNRAALRRSRHVAPPPIATTRTSSPYFSPNSASAPSATARSGVNSRVRTSALPRMRVVDLGLDRRDIGRRQRLRMAEIEAQPVGRDQRALLRDMLAEPVAQRLVQQMRHRMIGAQPAAALAIDAQFDRVADLQPRHASACRDGHAGRRPSSDRVAHRQSRRRRRKRSTRYRRPGRPTRRRTASG